MKLLVIVLCLFSERFVLHWSSSHRFRLFALYENFVTKKLAQIPVVSSAWSLLLISLCPWVIGIGLAYYLFSNLLFGFAGFLFSLILFYACIGPENPFYPARAATETPESAEEVGSYMVQVNGQLFAIIFWYAILGPLAILVYRLIAQSQQQVPISKQSTSLLELLDWLPTRLTMLLYLLVGNFQAGFPVFAQSFLCKPDKNQQLLAKVSLIALQSGKRKATTLLNAESLVEQALIVLLVILACFTLGSWT